MSGGVREGRPDPGPLIGGGLCFRRAPELLSRFARYQSMGIPT